MKVFNSRAGVVVGAVVVSMAIAGAALATPPSGILSGRVVARGSFSDPVDVTFKVKDGREEVTRVKGAGETVVQEIVIAPGGQTGWHSHHGPAVVLVTSGSLTIYSSEDPGCVGRTYVAGQAFVDPGQGHTHIAFNHDGSENTVLWVTYFDVPAGAPFRLDASDPGLCSF